MVTALVGGFNTEIMFIPGHDFDGDSTCRGNLTLKFTSFQVMILMVTALVGGSNTEIIFISGNDSDGDSTCRGI